jgi:hypothetical protein
MDDVLDAHAQIIDAPCQMAIHEGNVVHNHSQEAQDWDGEQKLG